MSACAKYTACAWGVATLTEHNSDRMRVPGTLKPVSFHAAQHTWDTTHRYSRILPDTSVCRSTSLTQGEATGNLNSNKTHSKTRTQGSQGVCDRCTRAGALTSYSGESPAEAGCRPILINVNLPGICPQEIRNKKIKGREVARPTVCSESTAEEIFIKSRGNFKNVTVQRHSAELQIDSPHMAA